MAGSPTVLSEIDAFTEGRRGRLRPWKWLVVPAALVGVVILFVPTAVGSAPWAPILHWNCQRGSMVDSRTYYTPGIFANSPYRGQVWANSSTSHLSYVASNGQAGGTLVPLVFGLYHAHNVTAGGPGPNHRCGARYLTSSSAFVQTSTANVPFTSVAAGVPSDAGETGPAAVPSSAYPVVAFTPSFRTADLPAVSTCQSGPASLTVNAGRFVVAATFYVNGHPVTMPVAVNAQLKIHYWFPAGGLWNIQNLGTSGGAFGAGWAFAYAGCPTPADATRYSSR